MRILVVEDQEDLAYLLKAGLESQCYAVDIEHDGERGFYRAKINHYDLILLDNMLPGKLGPDICRGLREYHLAMPILILSALSETDRKVNLLDCGADDYITKPFSFTELNARVRALLHRPNRMDSPILTAGDLKIDTDNYTVTRGEHPIYLTQKEFALLEYLVRHQGKVLSRSMIMEHVWDNEADPFSNNIETHIANLRRKIDRGMEKKLIRTLPGRGYTIDASV